MVIGTRRVRHAENGEIVVTSPGGSGGSTNPRYQVQAVSRAIQLLSQLAADTGGAGLSVTEVAGHLGTSKSATFATLQTLVAADFVATIGDGPTKRYRLGPALIRLGAQARAQISLSEVARPYLIDLTKRSHATSRLGVLGSDHVVVIDQVNPEITPGSDLRMGGQEHLHSSSMGKAILAELPQNRVRQLIEQAGAPQRTRRTLVELEPLLENLGRVAEVGYAVDDEEDADGIYCVGAAFHDHTGECIGAISVTGLKLEQPEKFYQSLGRLVASHAKAISAALGFVGTPALPRFSGRAEGW